MNNNEYIIFYTSDVIFSFHFLFKKDFWEIQSNNVKEMFALEFACFQVISPERLGVPLQKILYSVAHAMYVGLERNLTLYNKVECHLVKILQVIKV